MTPGNKEMKLSTQTWWNLIKYNDDRYIDCTENYIKSDISRCGLRDTDEWWPMIIIITLKAGSQNTTMIYSCTKFRFHMISSPTTIFDGTLKNVAEFDLIYTMTMFCIGTLQKEHIILFDDIFVS